MTYSLIMTPVLHIINLSLLCNLLLNIAFPSPGSLGLCVLDSNTGGLCVSQSYTIEHGTDYKTGLQLCICQSVSVCPSVGTFTVVFLDRFLPKFDTDVRTPKSKNEFVGGDYRTTTSPILPHKTPILGQEVLKIHANIT